MKSIPVLGTLVLNRGDLLLRLFESIDYPVDEFVIINNGNKADVKAAIDQITAKYPTKVTVHTPGKNTGVAGGWNWIFTHFDKPWYFIAGNDVMFTPGDLDKMVSAAWNEYETIGMLFGNQGHNAYIMTKACLDKVGLFDENFYPAYLEDCDYSRRMGLLDMHARDVQDCHIIHGEAPLWGSSTIHSDPRFRTMNGITHGNGFKYYRKKWGGENGKEVYTVPYNDPRLTPRDWVFDPEWRKLNDIWGA
jgi:GT2 family glycosyltransferase